MHYQNTNSRRLKSYSAMAAVILAGATANSQIVVTDVDPDFEFDSGGDLYMLDLNNDGQTDFFLYMATNSYPGVFMGVAPYGSLGSVNASTGSSGAYYYPLANHAGDIISAADAWYGYVGGFMTMASVSFYFSGSYGNWLDIAGGYLGLKIKVGADHYYGWARFDVTDGGFHQTLKEYAYNPIPEEGLCIGDEVGPADDCINAIEATTWIGLLDIADNGNGLDLGFSFNPSGTEAAVTEYRVIAVKSAGAASFDLATALTMTGDQYISIAPTGIPAYGGTLTEASLDASGDPITFAQPYKLFVLNMSVDYPTVLSAASAEITLSTPVAIEDQLLADVNIYPNPAADFILIDINNNAQISVIEMYDALGNLVQTVKCDASQQLKISVADLPAGNYFLRFNSIGTSGIYNFIKN